MQRYILQRLAQTVIVVLGLYTVVFVVLRLSGDPTGMLPPDVSRDEILLFRRAMGLDEPLWVQYWVSMGSLLRGDFGTSFYNHQPALELVIERLPATLELTAAAFFPAVLIAVPVGVMSAVKRGGVFDNIAMTLALLGQSMPTFWIGIMLIVIVSVQLGLLPTSGRGELRHLVLPAITLAAYAIASIARLTRSAMLDVLGKDYMRTARSKGLTAVVVLVRHGLKNAAIPVVTIIGLQLGLMLSGAVVTETVFSWPGIGRLAIQAISHRDYPVVEAVIFVIALVFVAVNLLVDLLYAILDPRVRYG